MRPRDGRLDRILPKRKPSDHFTFSSCPNLHGTEKSGAIETRFLRHIRSKLPFLIALRKGGGFLTNCPKPAGNADAD